MVMPILQPQIEEFKNEPDKNRDKCRKKKRRCGFRKRGGFSYPDVQAVHHQDKRPPCKTIKPCLYERYGNDEENG